jgi:hypothetical protein
MTIINFELVRAEKIQRQNIVFDLKSCTDKTGMTTINFGFVLTDKMHRQNTMFDLKVTQAIQIYAIVNLRLALAREMRR